jgi:hypothetical protein
VDTAICAKPDGVLAGQLLYGSMSGMAIYRPVSLPGDRLPRPDQHSSRSSSNIMAVMVGESARSSPVAFPLEMCNPPVGIKINVWHTWPMLRVGLLMD